MWKNVVLFFLAFGIGCIVSVFFESSDKTPGLPTPLIHSKPNQMDASLFTEPREIVSKADNARFFVSTSKSDQEVLDFFHKFQRAVVAHDKRTIAEMVEFPVCVRFARGDTGRKGCRELSRKSFLGNYDKIFDSDYKQFIANIDTHKNGQLGVLWANWKGVTADRGQFWFAGICRDKECSRTELKFTTLSSGFLQRPYDPSNHVD